MRGSAAIIAAGVVSPAGCGLEAVFESARQASPRTGWIRNFDASSFPSRVGGEVREGGRVVPRDPSVDRKEVFLGMAWDQLEAAGTAGWPEAGRRHLIVGLGLDYFDLPGFLEGGGPWQERSANGLDLARRLASIVGSKLAPASAGAPYHQSSSRISLFGVERAPRRGGTPPRPPPSADAPVSRHAP